MLKVMGVVIRLCVREEQGREGFDISLHGERVKEAKP